jgi:Na+/H+ antiporter NhaD/arsenite permease-like protein
MIPSKNAVVRDRDGKKQIMNFKQLLSATFAVPMIILLLSFIRIPETVNNRQFETITTITAFAGGTDKNAAIATNADKIFGAAIAKEKPAQEEHGLKKLSLLWILPFVGILLSIAIFPVVAEEWWGRNFPGVCLLWGLPVAAAMYFVLPGRTVQAAIEYCSFIALVGSLFVISGGILIRCTFISAPLTNCIMLLIGSLFASFIGTAGASMIMVRPMMRINAKRKSKAHIFIFFIFLISNIGGSLTPLGDPPLFLGFLQGVPFTWTLTHMAAGWAFAIAILLAVFFIVDTIILKRDGGVEGHDVWHKFGIHGGLNFVFLLGVLGTVILYGSYLPAKWGLLREAIQIILMCAMAALSMATTPKTVREENGFSWFPVKEVAILFAAIFACMIPTLNILEYKGFHKELNVTHPWQFFWMSGGLSSFLDNAPTYLTFLSLGKTLGLVKGACHGIAVIGGCVPPKILLGISMGSVFMGANTYIGNAPNFMVKSICEHNKVKMPSFFGYMLWSLLILEPLFLLITYVFFR